MTEKKTDALPRLTTRQLQARLKKLTGKPTKSKSRTTLVKRILAAQAASPKPRPHKTRRQLEVGTVLTRTHKGTEITVTVTADGFQHDGTTYRSLSTLAKAVTGYHVSGPAFFHLDRK
jgi:hypothetical protein